MSRRPRIIRTHRTRLRWLAQEARRSLEVFLPVVPQGEYGVRNRLMFPRGLEKTCEGRQTAAPNIKKKQAGCLMRLNGEE